MSAMEVILLERIDTLGKMGEVVRVKPGFARNYLLPQKKALRATKDNIAYFETQRAGLEKLNAEKKSAAEKQIKTLEGVKVVIIRHAAEGGQLYGSVAARDIAEAITAQAKQEVTRNQVQLNLGIKTIGLFPVTVALHPEVKIDVTVNIARTEEEAKQQAKTGKAVIVDASGRSSAEIDAEAAKRAMLDKSALAIEQQESVEAAEGDDSAERAEKSAKRQAKKKAKAPTDAAEEASEEADSDEE